MGNWPAAKRFCERSRGGCAPSLVRHDKTCFQWSPIDGTEMKISCERWEVKMRFICEVIPWLLCFVFVKFKYISNYWILSGSPPTYLHITFFVLRIKILCFSSKQMEKKSIYSLPFLSTFKFNQSNLLQPTGSLVWHEFPENPISNSCSQLLFWQEEFRSELREIIMLSHKKITLLFSSLLYFQ